MTNQQMEAVVSHPMHYNRGRTEVWDFIADWRMDYLRGNAVKYVCRAGFKDDRVQDLYKAREYLRKAQTNTTYRHIMPHVDFDPAIAVRDFADDQQLKPRLGQALAYICSWNLEGAVYLIEAELAEAEAIKQPEAKKAPPTVYGRDEKRFADPRVDRRVVEFGKRMTK